MHIRFYTFALPCSLLKFIFYFFNNYFKNYFSNAVSNSLYTF